MSSFTQALAYCFELERQLERRLMLQGPLLVGAKQTLLDEAHVESGELRFLNGGHVQGGY